MCSLQRETGGQFGESAHEKNQSHNLLDTCDRTKKKNPVTLLPLKQSLNV